MLQNQRACQFVRSKTGCEPLALAVAWGARTAGRCAAGVLGAVKHQRFSDQQLETFAARAPGICPKPVCDAGEPCPLPPQDDAVDVSVIVPVHNGERFYAPVWTASCTRTPLAACRCWRWRTAPPTAAGPFWPSTPGREGSPCCTRSRAAARPAPATPVWPGRWAAGSCLWIAMTACCRTQWRRCWRHRRVPGRISCRAAGSIATKPTPAVRCSSTQKRATPAPGGWMWWSCPALPGASCTAGPCLNGYGSPPDTLVLRMP